MREILFRTKAINRDKGEFRTKYKNGDWVYGLISRPYKDMFPTLPMEFRNENGVDGIEVDYKTVGQFTGLTDKNGKKIFEGDIVKFHTETYTSESDTIGKIEYFNGTFGISYKNGKHFLEFINMSMYVRWYEVIGNIHDNPELLEK